MLDGDGMGRAFPEVQMTTFMIYGAEGTPAALADEKGNSVVLSSTQDPSGSRDWPAASRWRWGPPPAWRWRP